MSGDDNVATTTMHW